MNADPLRSGPEVVERVRWRDVDVMGVVYYGAYLRFMEAAEDEFFRALGFSYTGIAETFGLWIARVRVEVAYRAPARLGDDVTCRAELREVGGSSLRFTFPIARVAGERLADGALTLAALDRTTLRPARIPPALRTALH